MKAFQECPKETMKKVAISRFNFSTSVLLFIITLLFCISAPSAALAQYSGYTYTTSGPWSCTNCPDADKDGVVSACMGPNFDPSVSFACLPDAERAQKPSEAVRSDCNDNDPYSHVFGSGNITSVKLTQFDEKGKVLSDPISPLLSLNRMSINVTFRVGCGLTTPYLSYLTNLKVFYGTKNAVGQEMLVEMPPPAGLPTGAYFQTALNVPTYSASYDSPMALLIEAPTSYADQVVEAAIESVATGRPVFLKFVGTTVGSRADTPFYYNIPNMSNCARVSGDGVFPIVAMRGKSAGYSVAKIIDKTIDFNWTFERKDPFKKYKDYFSYYVDLKNHDDGAWLTQFYKVAITNSVINQNNFFDQIPSQSSCQPIMATYLWYGDIYKKFGGALGISSLNGRALIVDSGKGTVTGTVKVPIHEFGHAFAGLNDEYNYKKDHPIFPGNRAQCAYNPRKEFSFNNILYAPDYYLGCSFDRITAETLLGGGRSINSQNVYRPSFSSIMSNDDYDMFDIKNVKFNVPSCAYIIKRIIGSSAPVASYFPECWGLDTDK